MRGCADADDELMNAAYSLRVTSYSNGPPGGADGLRSGLFGGFQQCASLPRSNQPPRAKRDHHRRRYTGGVRGAACR